MHLPTTEVMICSHCDTAHRRVPLEKSQVAHCSRCDAVLGRHRSLSTSDCLALVVTASVLLVIASTTPVLAIEFGGIHTQANVVTSSLSLATGWMSWPAAVLGLTMFLIPLMQILALLWLLLFANTQRRAPGAAKALLLVHVLRPWSMTEVFLLGVLVAIAKLSNWVHVTAEVGVWALAGLTLILTRLSIIDRRSWWSLADEVS